MRNLIDIDDVYKIVAYILSQKNYLNTIINIANPQSYLVKDIIAVIETVGKLKADYTSIEKGQVFDINISLISPVIDKLRLNFGSNYLFNLLKKYYYPNDLSKSYS
jgi:nucleoside-diphosphate-sugar epimerase